MTKEKINELFEKSQDIINMMNELGIKGYSRYSITETAVGNFLRLDNIPITPYLIDTYIDDDLSKFMPNTTVEIIEKFEYDIENNIFDELEILYLSFTQK